MRFALVNVENERYGFVDGLWMQNFTGTLEEAAQWARETEQANSNKITVAVVEDRYYTPFSRIFQAERLDVNKYLDVQSKSFKQGDVCIYSFGDENQSRALVEILDIKNDPRGVAEIKFLEVMVDDTGNGLFEYLQRTGKTMNASFQYLKIAESRQSSLANKIHSAEQRVGGTTISAPFKEPDR